MERNEIVDNLFRVGDKFKFNVDLMNKNNISTTGTDNNIHEVLCIGCYRGLGEIITYEIWEYNGMQKAQCNSVWLIKQ